MLGLICPSNDPNLVTNTGNAASSAWVIAIQRAGIKVLPHIANACFLSALLLSFSFPLRASFLTPPAPASALSAGSSSLYTSSRSLYGLARNNQAPKIFAYTNSKGTPIYALVVSAALAALSYLAVSETSSTVFGWFSNMISIAGMFNWFGICLTGIRFRQGLKAQGINCENLPWHSRLVPFAAWWGLVWTIVIILFADWTVFLTGNWDAASFIANYLPIPIFFCLFFGYKFWYGTKWIRASEMDFVTGITSWKNQ